MAKVAHGRVSRLRVKRKGETKTQFMVELGESDRKKWLSMMTTGKSYPCMLMFTEKEES